MIRPVVLVGGGNMGGALLRGWLARAERPSAIYLIDPNAEALERLRAALPTAAAGGASGAGTINFVAGLDEVPGNIIDGIVLFAVKPQIFDTVVAAYAGFGSRGFAFLTIAAGPTIAQVERLLGQVAVVRAMPNTPAAIGRGISVACPNGRVTEPQRQACHGLLSAVGEVAWVEDESLMDVVTATSGSGPAYVFLLIESLAAAGVASGLPEDLALRLAKATVAGAGELAHQSDQSPAALRERVTSPKGTTAAALEVLMAGGGVPDLLRRAVAAATRRSRELAG